jgi:hypothetical protein
VHEKSPYYFESSTILYRGTKSRDWFNSVTKRTP